MNTQIFSIYDTKAKVYGTPFFQSNIGVALRSFSDLANDPQSSINKHPEDYFLFHLGNYDDEKANFDMLDTLTSIGSAMEYMETEPVPDLTNVYQHSAGGTN